eukprot:3308543-Lingulodinium_polyedra.AAC.1
MVLIVVDDLIVATVRRSPPPVRQNLEDAFTFGRWSRDAAVYLGRHIERREDAVLISMEKYILEHLHPLPLPRHRKGDHRAALRPEEAEFFRSM